MGRDHARLATGSDIIRGLNAGGGDTHNFYRFLTDRGLRTKSRGTGGPLRVGMRSRESNGLRSLGRRDPLVLPHSWLCLERPGNLPQAQAHHLGE